VKSTRLAASVLVMACGLALAGCGADYDHTDISNVRVGPLGGRVNYARVDVVVGALVVAHVANVDDDKDPMKTEFVIKDNRVVDVQGVVSDGDYAFFGLSVGTTEVEIRAAGKLVLILSVYVSAQPPLP